MDQSFKLLYFDLLPPPPFLREANKIVTCSWLILIFVSLCWSFGAFPSDPLSGIVDDGIIVGTALMQIWFVSILVSSFWRLKRYRDCAAGLPAELFQLLYPIVGATVINLSILSLSLLAYVIPTARPAWRGLFLAEISPLLAFEIPIVKNWLPRFEPMRFVDLFRSGLSILLGREFGTPLEKHAQRVVEFQNEFINYLELKDKPLGSKKLEQIAAYYNAADLAVFQRTLSCRYGTSRLLADRLGSVFQNRSWKMLDIGGGEGIFTGELLANIGTAPHALTVIDPAEDNLHAYTSLITEQFPAIRNIEGILGKIEDVVDDLPEANLVLASHSLYTVMDLNRRSAARVLVDLLRKSKSGVTVLILASRDSSLYSVKRSVLSELHRVDRSSYGEELQELIPDGWQHTTDTVDSVVDVTGILQDYEALISWMAYFCRLTTEELRPHFDLCQRLVRDSATELRCLPETEQRRLASGDISSRMNLTKSSRIIFHKEKVYTVTSRDFES